MFLYVNFNYTDRVVQIVHCTCKLTSMLQTYEPSAFKVRLLLSAFLHKALTSSHDLSALLIILKKNCVSLYKYKPEGAKNMSTPK
jgi:hypothetical protein